MKAFVFLSLSVMLFSCDSKTESLRIMKYANAPSLSVSPRVAMFGTQEESREDIPPPQRMIIKTASLTLEVETYDSVFVELQKLVGENKGFIVSSDISASGAKRKTGRVTVRIPSACFEATVDAIANFSSRVISKSIEGNDVTEEYVDVSARLENKKKIEARYREILKFARTVEDILAVEKYLGEIREEIERLEGRKRFLGDQTALSTIRISFQEPKAFAEYEGKGFWGKVAEGFRQGLTGFGDVLGTTISVMMASIPLVVLLLLGIFISRRLFKRYRTVHHKS